MTDSKRKGKRGELELAGELSRVLNIPCRRGQQFHGLEGQDVIGLPGVHLEVKRTERLQLRPALAQASQDAGEGQVPVVCHRSNREPWLISLQLTDLPAFVRAVNAATLPRPELRVVLAAAAELHKQAKPEDVTTNCEMSAFSRWKRRADQLESWRRSLDGGGINPASEAEESQYHD